MVSNEIACFPHVFRMFSACFPHVFRMFSACFPHGGEHCILLRLDWIETGLGLDWNWIETGLGLDRDWIGTGLGLDCTGFIPVSNSFANIYE